MEHGKFAELQDAILQPLANRLVSKWPGLKLRDVWASRIEDSYEECRRYMRSEMLRHGIPEADLRIDRHKVGAALAWAVLRVIPFTYAGRAMKILYQLRPNAVNPFMLANLLFVLEQYHLAVTP